MAVGPSQHPQLKKTLKTRHLTMIAMGGIIGAALFVGSSAVISEAGPAAFIAYALTGGLVMLVMRALGEMAAAKPSTGTFVDYSRMALGEWAGFVSGWLYWYFWVIVVGFEAIVGGQIINGWLPGIPVWVIALTLMVVMTAVNMMSVRSFGEAEYVFSSIKVGVVIVFLIIAGLCVVHIWPNSTASLSNLTAHGGFTPNGVSALFASTVVIVFSMMGAEVVTIAAAESEEPARNVRRAINSVVVRVMLFFVLSTLLIVIIKPWDEIEPGKSPFVAVLNDIGIPAGGQILTVVILIAVLSLLNAGMYTSSRLLFVLASQGHAPQWMTSVNRRGVPSKGVLACTVTGYACVVVAALWPDTVFMFLINSSGAVILFVYLMVCISQIRLRRRWEQEGTLQVKMWGHPWVSLLASVAIVAMVANMAANSSTRASLVQSLVSAGVIFAAYAALTYVRRNRSRDHYWQEESDRFDDSSPAGDTAIAATSDLD
ncbi:amino acid permease [Rhodococcus pyridinivorans]|uniref:amino acid permease n=1 Tax=Rhodococcus pyridinivorans TaxID=103816 RepID=UPI001E301D4C|nr:amino acid permease [Rhodococcus pyridinivorans]MCD5422859.1 amino acid permease [Rhodococcus pyridinivorans]